MMIATTTEAVGNADFDLINEIQSADSLESAYAARNALVEKYLPLVDAVVRRILSSEIRQYEDDCRQEAACALLEAAARAHVRPEDNFPAYARVCMYHRVCTYIQRQRFASRSPRLGRSVARLKRIVEDRGGDLSDAALARESGFSMAKIRALRIWLQAPLRFGTPADDEATNLAAEAADDAPSPSDRAAESEAIAQLHALIADLDPRDRHLVRHIYGLDGEEPSTMTDAVAALGFSRQRGGKRLHRTLRRLQATWCE
jgi:RNA polymerase sigma factor (sigma-70 family)